MVDDSFPQSPKTHVTGHRELTPSAPDSASDLYDGDLGHGSVGLAHKMKSLKFFGFLGGTFNGEFQDGRNIKMGDEKIGVVASQYNHSN